MDELVTQYRVPSNSGDFVGEYIVFFANDANPQLLFHSIVPDQAYQAAQSIKKETGKETVVLRVPSTAGTLTQNLIRG